MRRLSVIFWIAAVAHGAEPGTGTLTGVVRSPTQAVANAVVYLNLSGGRGDVTNPPPIVLRQLQSEWNPRIQLARCGAALMLRNDDPTLHVVHVDLLRGTNQPRRLLSVAMPYAGYQQGFQLEAYREPVLLRASTGNGERALGYVAVLPHAWGAVTDEQGRFNIPAVPAGTWKVYVWHENYGTLNREARIVSGQTTELPVNWPAP
jgi:hypothetical protein